MATAANRRVIGFLHEARFRHRGASVFVSLRPSATVAAWHPGPAAPVRGKASARLGCISLPPACVATAPRRLRPLVFARLHPRPKTRRRVSAASPAASRCSPSLATLSVCLGQCFIDSRRERRTPNHFCPFPPPIRQ